MNKLDLIAAVADRAALSEGQSAAVILAFQSVIATELAANREVSIMGFGAFSTRIRAARVGRHPATGAVIAIPQSVAVTFKPGAVLNRHLS